VNLGECPAVVTFNVVLDDEINPLRLALPCKGIGYTRHICDEVPGYVLSIRAVFPLPKRRYALYVVPFKV